MRAQDPERREEARWTWVGHGLWLAAIAVAGVIVLWPLIEVGGLPRDRGLGESLRFFVLLVTGLYGWAWIGWAVVSTALLGWWGAQPRRALLLHLGSVVVGAGLYFAFDARNERRSAAHRREIEARDAARVASQEAALACLSVERLVLLPSDEGWGAEVQLRADGCAATVSRVAVSAINPRSGGPWITGGAVPFEVHGVATWRGLDPKVRRSVSRPEAWQVEVDYTVPANAGRQNVSKLYCQEGPGWRHRRCHPLSVVEFAGEQRRDGDDAESTRTPP